ncbi:MAG TPA: hypothetical protein PKA90_10615 [Ignavibacteria bacterium]|nr:hypothetical protein [Ignavibacteria bacterium]HMR40869.1 hypothetical protein [Ignavibacteria bacterium]
MPETLLIKFLKTLNQNEIRQFRDFIYSPTFNKNTKIAELFELHYKHYPEFNSGELSDNVLFENIFKDEVYQYSKIKNLISDLFGLGKEFLAFNFFRKNQNIKEKFLLSELRLRNLDSAFEKAFKAAEKRIENIKKRNEEFYLHKFDLQFEIMSYYSPKKPNVNFDYLQKRLDLFIDYSATVLLKIYNIMHHENSQNNFKFDMKMFGNVMEYFKNNEIKDNPTLEIYYYILLLETTKDEKYFYVLKDLRLKYKEKLTIFDNYMLYLHLDSYCATAFNEHCRTDLLNEQFLLVKENLMFELVGDGKILYPDFLNEVKKAVRVNQFKWAEDYIIKYKCNLTEEIDNTLNFCHGYISYKKGELEKALDYFSRTNFPNFIIKIQVKLHLLQLYIDLEYYEQAILMIDSFKHYLTRERSLIDSMKISVFEFLKISGDLIKVKTEVLKKDKDFRMNKLKQDIENMSNNRFGIKLWLKEKIVDG